MAKRFFESLNWKEVDIKDYVNTHSVLVLFKLHIFSGEADLLIHGDLNEKEKLLLKVCIIGKFGGKNISDDLYVKINEYAEEWHNDFVKQPSIRVLNFKKRK